MNQAFRRLSGLFLLISFLTVTGIGSSKSCLAADFPKPFDTEKSKETLLNPKATLAKMKLPPGFNVSLFAAEPDVHQPIGFCTDARGRLWVAENYTYGEREVNFDRRLKDRIVILEDTDGDGEFDKRKVFWDDAQLLTSVEVGFGGVWALCAPNLLFIPDKNGDDIPDSKPIVVLNGWDDDVVRHNIVNGLRWGPDGWLYGRHGIKATSFVGKPGDAPSTRTPINCGIWRYHPTLKKFEVVCYGTTNPWGFDYDDHGEMFFINTVIGHLWHILPGGHYKRMYGGDFNPHLYDLIDQTADHFHWDTAEAWSETKKGMSGSTDAAGGGHAHTGMMIYLGDNWPKEYRNNVFTVNLHGLRLNRDILERHGATYTGKHAPDLLKTTDPWFRAVEMIYGPDGGVFIADWSDVGECHENDGVHRSSGRIYKVTYGTPKKVTGLDLSKKSNSELVKLQLHKNDWYVRKARRILQERAAAGQNMDDAVSPLLDILNNHSNVTRQLRALWCLNSIDAITETQLVKLLNHENEHLRVWAVRLLSDRDLLHGSNIAQLTKLAEIEKSGLVQTHLASTLQKLPAEQRWGIAANLTRSPQFHDDRVLPLMVWYGIEDAVPANWKQAIELAGSSQIPLVRQYIARRVTADIEQNPQAVAALIGVLKSQSAASNQLDILHGMSESLRGWRKAPIPKNWEQASIKLAKSSNKDILQLTRELSVVFGGGRALDEVKQIALNGKADPNSRRDAIRILSKSQSPEILALLRKLVNDRLVASAAIRGLAEFSDPKTPSLILNQYPRMEPDGKEAVVETLTTRPEYANALLAAVEAGIVDRQKITAFQARQIRSFNNSDINKLLVKLWGEVRETSADKKSQIAKLQTEFTVDELSHANLSAGRALFKKSCAICHTLYGQGAKVGPDLTGANRHNMNYLLENIIDPSATMLNDFKMSVIALDNGRVVSGVILQKTGKILEVQTQKEKVFIDESEVAEIVKQNLSLMPEGLLNQLSKTQIRDLFGYLSGKTQVPLPETKAVGP